MELPINITVTELRYILAVAKELNFRRAAAICFVSQPTLSIAIKKLEANLGTIIFERSKTNVIITEIGKLIIEKAQLIINLVTEVKLIAQEEYTNPYTTPLKIGAIHTIGPYLFPNLIDNLTKNNSNINLIIEEGYTEFLYDKLLNGKLDAIIVAAPFRFNNISTTHLYSEPLDVILPKNHPWTKRINITPDELNNQTILLLNKGNCFRDQVLQICPQCINYGDNKNNPANLITTTSLETIKYMVIRNMGISIMPRSAILLNHGHDQFIIKQFVNPQPKREILIAYRDSFSRKYIIDELKKIILSLQLYEKPPI